MIRIGIIEDEENTYLTIKEYLTTFFNKNNKEINIEYFNTAEKLLSNYDVGFDLIFMDINLPKMNGLEASKKIREKDNLVMIIFVTSLAQYAIKGYEVNAFDYIVKPINYYSFELKLTRVLKKLDSKNEKFILINNKQVKRKVSLSNIKYIEVMKHVLIFHTIEGDFCSSGILKNVVDEVKGSSFYLCNQCYLVNLKYVDRVEGYNLYIDDEKLLISHPKKKEFMKVLNDYLSNGGK